MGMAAGACKEKKGKALNGRQGIGCVSMTNAATVGIARRERRFHVKHRKSGKPTDRTQGGIANRWLVVLTFATAFMAGGFLVPANAAVYKCTGADGKVVFSDQPCLAGQTTTGVREPAGAPAAKPQDTGEGARVATRARLRAAQTPECADMSDRIASFGQTGGATATNAQMTALLTRYEQQCAARMQQAIEAENKRKEDEANKRIVADAACAEKRRVLNERRAKLAAMGDADKRVFATIEAEVARDCR
jgi:Domain of unknown function (DUF4124)